MRTIHLGDQIRLFIWESFHLGQEIPVATTEMSIDHRPNQTFLMNKLIES